ncbi:hypothetical protein IT084_09630 [Desulfallas sp. Bu1-1]|uniref:hypothetical protein n=1 Tax=Desulfallas sp. Bu1-1 TaxID=2787620 RepID=UPI00189D6AF9|nr:hypothetical protein [Desulfallas sp. Bu1-1]MBF7083233.1 hypothetical protein [Desulfallas sp. Bu1-1]
MLLLSLADITATRLASGFVDDASAYRKFILDILGKYTAEGSNYLHPPGLLDGNDVCRLLGIKPSPRVRRVLDALAEAQVEGLVKTVNQAEEFVKQWRD